MVGEKYTLLVVSEKAEKTRRFHLSRSSLRMLIFAVFLTVAGGVGAIIYSVFQFKHVALLNTENVNEIKKYVYNNGIDKYEYLIIGHTDTKGTKKYNYELSIQRANSIKNLLNKLGVNLDKIRVVGKGEERLAIPTPDEIPHPANRRAIIKASY